MRICRRVAIAKGRADRASAPAHPCLAKKTDLFAESGRSIALGRAGRYCEALLLVQAMVARREAGCIIAAAMRRGRTAGASGYCARSMISLRLPTRILRFGR